MPLPAVRDLGVTIDQQLTMKSHVNTVVRNCFYELRQLRSVRRSLTDDATRALVHAFVASRVDYCNAVLYGATDGVVRRLQAVLNSAARLITGTRRNDHITPVLRDVLHWLPVRQRILYKIALLSYDCVHGTCPTYLADICIPVSSLPARAALRSAARGDLVEPSIRGKRYGPRSFRISAPHTWNNLPSHLRSYSTSREQFTRDLKTWLFSCAYS
jgi:hypothetical protein